MTRVIWITFLFVVAAFAGTLDTAQKQYDRTDYAGALKTLDGESTHDGQFWALTGKSWFMRAEYKKAIEAFDKAVAAEPRNSVYAHWLGRAWGRRAETSNPLLAAGYASKARTWFEHAVMLDARNKEALNDLFDYYMEAPGLLGGGFDKAERLIDRIAALDPAEGSYARAQLLDRRNRYDEAEQHLRRAVELAPRQAGRVIDLAMYLSKRGRVEESEAAFTKASQLEPDNPYVLFKRAETYVRDGRNLNQARDLLHRYLAANLTPDNPSREEAQALLKKIS
jgi:tetratricopeptide (TPR) repeat protein